GIQNSANAKSVPRKNNLRSDLKIVRSREFPADENRGNCLIRYHGLVGRPRALNLPPRIDGANAGDKFFLAMVDCLGEVGADQLDLGIVVILAKIDLLGEKRRVAIDVVSPEYAFDLYQIGFRNKGALARRLQVDAANVHVKRVFNRRDDQVGAQGAQL